MEKKAIDKTGWLNRKESPLPKELSIIKIIYKDFDGEHEFECLWKPLKILLLELQHWAVKPSKSLIGTAVVIDEEYNRLGIGFHAWKNNDHEFIYFKYICDAIYL